MSRWSRIALLLLVFSPALLSAAIVANFAVDVPVWDDLERATLLQKWTQGTLDWRYVYSPHIEHRMTVPRLITLASVSFGDGSVWTEQAVIFFMVVATALLVYGLLRQTFPGRPRVVYALSFAANVLLFSPLQWETFLFAIQTSFVAPPLGLCLALWALNSRLGYAAKFAVCFFAAVLATNSFSHGMLLWAVVLAAVALQHRFGSARARFVFLGFWLLATSAVLTPHFTVGGYANTSDFAYVEKGERAPGLSLATLPDRAPRAIQFFGAILGSSLARTTVLDPRAVAPYGAAILLGVFGLAAAWALRRHRDTRLWDRWLPWLAVGGWAVVASAAPAIGRSALNKWSYGLVPHYLTVSLYLLLADVVLVALLVEDSLRRSPRPGLRAALPRAAALCAGALLAFQALQWGIGVVGMREWQSARLQARTAMLFIDHFDPVHILRLGGVSDDLKLVKLLNDVGYLRPPILPDARLCHFEIDPAPVSSRDALLKSVWVAGSNLVVEGYARLSESGRRADGVLFTARGAAGVPVVVTPGEMDGVPYVSVSAADHRLNGVRVPGVEEFAGFRTKIPLDSRTDGGAQQIQVWVVDSARMRVRPFSQHLVVSTDSGRPRAELQAGPGEPRPLASTRCARRYPSSLTP